RDKRPVKAVTLAAVAAALISACASATASAATVKVVHSRYGPVVADGRGQAVYVFTKEDRGVPQCYSECAMRWPPFLTTSKPRAGKGVKRSLIGTRRRRDGKLQVTYRGRPLYFYDADKPGLILCQNVFEFGGDWLVVAPSGRPVR